MTIFVNKGDAPLTDAQLHKRTQRLISRDWPQWKRERDMRKGKPELNSFMSGVEASTDTNRSNNAFNWQLAEYRTATARLAQYVLADGRAAVYEDQPTGEFDESGLEVVESVLVQSAIDPLDATVERLVYADDPMVEPTAETIPNPLIVQDVAERAAAQAVIDGTPEDVKAH
jgi:hypothetical protein